MTEDELIEILDADTEIFNEKGCDILSGLLIVKKYLPLEGISGADHDIVYSCSIEDLCEAGITTEDAERLNMLGWMEMDGALASFA